MTLLELNYQRRKTTETASALLDNAVLERRSLTAADQVRFDTLTAHMHGIDRSIIERESFREVAA
jgi:hypothetical protein